MNRNILKTAADDLYELVKSNKKISVDGAAKLLNLPVETVQALVEFLVEEKVFGIEYKFTTPYIYISREIVKKHPKDESKNEIIKGVMEKEEFLKKSHERNISAEKIEPLWKKYVFENINSIKDEFYKKGRLRNFPRDKIDNLWQKYKKYLE